MTPVSTALRPTGETAAEAARAGGWRRSGSRAAAGSGGGAGLVAQAARRAREASASARASETSLFLVGLDQQPVGIARSGVAAEGPQVARLDRVAQRAGDDLPFGIAGDGGDVRLEADGDDRDAALERRFAK